ncbi:MAG TPA: tetratricopeptide repeat protein [Candidatus Binatia bacterium]
MRRQAVREAPSPARHAGTARAWWLVAGIVALLACLVYANSLGGELLFDDVNAVVNNRWVRSGDVAGIVTQASWWGEGRGHTWRPLTTLTFALDHALHGIAPLGYHVVNVALHAAVSVLVFAVFARLAGEPAVAAIAALLFAAHPVHTEAVASVVGRAELLAAFAVFAAWLCFLHADARRLAGRAALVPEALGVLLLFLGELSKENALGFLFVLVLADLLFAERAAPLGRLRVHAGRYAALVAVSLAFMVARHAVIGDAAAAPISILDNPLVGLPFASYELTAIKVIGLYAWRLLVPWTLAADYSYDQLTAVTSPLDPAFLGGLAVVVAVPLLVWRTWRAVPLVALGLGIAVLTFAIVSNVVFPIGTIMAERLVYLPSAGFCLALAAGFTRVAGGTRRAPAAGALDGLTTARVALPLVVVLVLYGARTVARNRVWHDRLGFFTTMVQEAPRSARSQRELGSVLADLGRFEEARAAFTRSLAIRPNDGATLYNLGNALAQESRFDDAIAAYQQALTAVPDLADAMVNLGNVQSLRGDHAAAVESMRRALPLTPRSASLHMNIANELFRLGDHAGARAEYEAALTLDPGAPNILVNYGAFFLARGEYEQAADAYRRAGDQPMALVGLSATYRAQGKTADARAAQTRAAALYPANAAVRQMGEVLQRDAAGASGG